MCIGVVLRMHICVPHACWYSQSPEGGIDWVTEE